MSNGEEFNRIEDLKKRLYDREAVFSGVKRSKLIDRSNTAPTSWSSPSVEETSTPVSSGWLYKVALLSAIFFALTLGVAGFWFIKGANLISNQNIDFTIEGPATAKAGDATSFQVVITNRNKVALDNVKINIVYPTGTKSAINLNQDLETEDLVVGNLAPGESANLNLSARLFGLKDDQKDLNAIISYRVVGSNAIYKKSTDYKLLIGSAPISVDIESVPESVVDHEVSLKIRVYSNIQSPVDNVLVKVLYPHGFNLLSSDVKPNVDTNVWHLGTLKPGDEKIINIRGTLGGIHQEIKTFQGVVGVKDDTKPNDIKDQFGEIFKTITLKQPFIALGTKINGSEAVDLGLAGGLIRVDVDWFNTLSSKIINSELFVVINGEPFNPVSVTPGNGFYRLSEKKILWNQISEQNLADLAPGDNGETSFSFNTFSLLDSQMINIVNPEVNLDFVISGTRISDGFANEKVETKIRRKIRLDSVVLLSAKTLYKTGPFTNQGLLPPKVDQPTTYTVNLSMINTSNDVIDTQVRAVVPNGVNFINEISPSNEQVEYNSVTREITWRLGKVNAGTGTRLPPREVFFKVSLVPSIRDVKKTPSLLEQITLQAVDSFTGNNLSYNKGILDNRLLSEAGFEIMDALVVE